MFYHSLSSSGSPKRACLSFLFLILNISDVLTRSNATAALLRSQEREEGERGELFIVFRKRPKPARTRSLGRSCVKPGAAVKPSMLP
ncbi:uncharacterized protein NEPG_02087 [Nematocida parisii ERTm1]|uniref:uncharacterized protein n=1 Tax=Nematocida parisii (strain ERTm1 / ATCC PRA-289) TaxID=881290 RepID=UPI000264BA2C|nr:uncharacterized protein NEPG_02087 [Nematocida parisii ERTm1]EIJ93131.1 hypothetical protein NEPG_02087 [Nematocida parisii ERTm1]|eukprot:XP_013059914.1 hypothetical protein NEPG_02087 [Nematocida parisii ERTm1]